MPIEISKRHWSIALLLHIAIRLRFFAESWCGLKPLLSSSLTAYPSPWRPKNAPKYDLITQYGFVWLWFLVGLSRELAFFYYVFAYTGVLHLFNAWHKWLSNRLIGQMKTIDCKSSQREISIPEYDWKSGNPQEFYETFVKRPHPVVLRGFMKDTKLLQNLSWDKVMKEYGNEDVFLTKPGLDGYPGKLREVDNPQFYLHNSEVLFMKYPEIREWFEYFRLEPYLKQKVGYEQIFVGREGTGSPFHHAAVYNMFYQIDGKKQWWFVDPYDSFLAYPLQLWGKAANFLFCLFPNEYNKEAFPLFEYCPVYSTVLEPGDVLFNPPWWWHSIKNISETTVAVASRWHTDGIAGHACRMTEEDYDIDRISSFFFFLGHRSWSFLHGILQTPSPRFDEHKSLREVKNRYVHLQVDMAAQGGVNVAGVVTKF